MEYLLSDTIYNDFFAILVKIIKGFQRDIFVCKLKYIIVLSTLFFLI